MESLRASWEQRVTPLRPRLIAYATVLCRSIQGAVPDDLVQSALLTAWQRAGLFDPCCPDAALYQWLRVFVFHASREDRRRQERERPYDPQLIERDGGGDCQPRERGGLPVLVAEPDADARPSLRSLLPLLDRCRLTVRQRQAIELHSDGFSVRKIAEILRIGKTSAAIAVRSALFVLRVAVDEAERDRQSAQARSVYEESQRRYIYRAPVSTGACLDREKLARLAAQDACADALCRAAIARRSGGPA